MELLNQEVFLSILNYVRDMDPEVYKNEKCREYIDIDKAKNIIKLVLKNEKLNQFLISGFLDKYVEFIYRNQEGIKNSTLDVMEQKIPEGDFVIKLPCEDFKKIISKIVIDDIHLPDAEIEDVCKVYEELKENKELDNKISFNYVKEYATFIYYNRYQIRKLESKDLPKIKMDVEGNYILRDEDFVGKVNNDGGHNSPLWICIYSDKDETEERGNKKFKEIIEEKINFFKNISESRIEKKEEKILRKQIEEHQGDMGYEDVVKPKEIRNDIVVKNLLPENERETALIAEEIARQLGFPVAQYYPAKYIGTAYTKETAEQKQREDGTNYDKELVYVTEKIVLTPNFLEPGEELITGDRIAQYEMDVAEVPKCIEAYFKKEGVDDEKIKDLISDYRIVMAYNCFINHRDCHNGNWGYIKDANGEYKISHIFDLEGSLDENNSDIRAIFVGDKSSFYGSNIDEFLLEELLEDKKCRDRVKDFLNLNLQKVFRNVTLSKRITIPKAKQCKVMKVIEKEKQIFSSIIEKFENEKFFDDDGLIEEKDENVLCDSKKIEYDEVVR
ncbi:MAG: hypothetical protein IKD77_03355 [Bacilli bacterium]|nr:hypothetical protein [Bacilli bacterium]